MNTLLFALLIGGSIGAVVGYFNKSKSKTGPLTAGWGQGLFWGAVFGVLFYVLSGCGNDPAAMNQSTANVKLIKDAEFDTEVMQASQPVIVDCYATWCGPCRLLAPIVDNLADEYAGKIKFVKVNVDESPQVSKQYHIEAIPTLLFFKNGKLMDTSVGLVSKADLAARLDFLLATKIQPAAPVR